MLCRKTENQWYAASKPNKHQSFTKNKTGVKDYLPFRLVSFFGISDEYLNMISCVLHTNISDQEFGFFVRGVIPSWDQQQNTICNGIPQISQSYCINTNGKNNGIENASLWFCDDLEWKVWSVWRGEGRRRTKMKNSFSKRFKTWMMEGEHAAFEIWKAVRERNCRWWSYHKLVFRNRFLKKGPAATFFTGIGWSP